MGEKTAYHRDIKKTQYRFSTLFDIHKIQKLQDLFSAATGVASLITEPDGAPITEPSGFCSLCNIIRETETGRKDCLLSNGMLSSPEQEGPKIQRCMNGGLLTCGASIIIDGQHIANWLVGQVLDEDYEKSDLLRYADIIGVKREVFEEALLDIRHMSKSKFENICNFLYVYVQQFSNIAVQNYSLLHEINEKTVNEAQIKNLNNELELKIRERTIQLEESNAELEEINATLEEEIVKRQKVEDELYSLNEDLETKIIERTQQLQDLNSILEEEIVEKTRVEDELNKERMFTDALFDSAPGMIYLYDDQSRLVRWNKNHEKMTGYNSAELANMNLLDWYKGDLKSQTSVREGVKKVYQSGLGDAEAELQKKDGTKIPMYFRARLVTIADKHYFAGIGIDITERKQLHERLQKYQVLAESANDAMLFIDTKGHILEANNAAVKTYGYSQKEFSEMRIFDLRPREVYADIFEQMELADQEGIIFESTHQCKDGTCIDVEVSSHGTFLGDKRVLLSIIRDITIRKKKEDENRYLSYHDALTGLYNRRFYEKEIQRLDTETNLPISIILGDLNGLKIINDAFGHDKGDELLRKAAKAIQSACRKDDIVARWGGDEFVLLLPKTNSAEAEKIVSRIKELHTTLQVNAVSVSMSFGWDTKKTKGDDILKVLKNAEDIMYKHKIIEDKGMRSNIINTIINTLHEKNPREEAHSKRVSQLCQILGKAKGLSESEVNRLKVAGLLHDIGKIAIEEGILNKPGILTEKEWKQIKLHPEIGFRILSSSYEMVELAECILAHHERWDGRGYPKGLKGEEIPLISRIISLADSYDAMISQRPYRQPLSPKQALLEIEKNSGTQFDPEIARIFVEQGVKLMK